MIISFSPSKPANWKGIPLPTSSVTDWLRDQYLEANDRVKTIFAFQPFFPTSFIKAHLKAILAQDGCKYLSFNHFLVQDAQDNSKFYSTLIAYGRDEEDLVLEDKEGLPERKYFIGTPATVDFGARTYSEDKVEIVNNVPNFTWKIMEAPNTKITDWLKKPLVNNRFKTGIDFLIRVRLEVDEANTYLNQYSNNEHLIVIYPTVCHCKIDKHPQEKTGEYCSLLLCGDTATPSFKLSTDAWRPNWPRGGSIVELSL